MAVLNGHVEALFPYISNTGSLSPESCVFAQCTNIAAFLILCCVYVKYLQVIEFPTISSGSGVSDAINRTALVFGIISCIGFDIVGNFQESNIIVVHMIGAVLCFGAGTIYFSIQLWISYKIPGLTSRVILIVRTVIVTLCIVFTFTTMFCGIFSYMEAEEKENREAYMKWKPEDGGWELHLISAFSEWILGFSYCAMFLSYVPEFYAINVHTPVITFKKMNNSLFTVEE
ncbi:DNA damage-regulated autophagy modulator protein 2-like isoform X2 [Periplaneta americana]